MLTADWMENMRERKREREREREREEVRERERESERACHLQSAAISGSSSFETPSLILLWQRSHN